MAQGADAFRPKTLYQTMKGCLPPSTTLQLLRMDHEWLARWRDGLELESPNGIKRILEIAVDQAGVSLRRLHGDAVPLDFYSTEELDTMPCVAPVSGSAMLSGTKVVRQEHASRSSRPAAPGKRARTTAFGASAPKGSSTAALVGNGSPYIRCDKCFRVFASSARLKQHTPDGQECTRDPVDLPRDNVSVAVRLGVKKIADSRLGKPVLPPVAGDSEAERASHNEFTTFCSAGWARIAPKKRSMPKPIKEFLQGLYVCGMVETGRPMTSEAAAEELAAATDEDGNPVCPRRLQIHHAAVKSYWSSLKKNKTVAKRIAAEVATAEAAGVCESKESEAAAAASGAAAAAAATTTTTTTITTTTTSSSASSSPRSSSRASSARGGGAAATRTASRAAGSSEEEEGGEDSLIMHDNDGSNDHNDDDDEDADTTEASELHMFVDEEDDDDNDFEPVLLQRALAAAGRQVDTGGRMPRSLATRTVAVRVPGIGWAVGRVGRVDSSGVASIQWLKGSVGRGISEHVQLSMEFHIPVDTSSTVPAHELVEQSARDRSQEDSAGDGAFWCIAVATP